MIPYGKHHIDKNDINAVINVLKSKHLTQGPLINEFEKKIAKYVGAKYCVAVSSCSAGLHIAAIVSGIKKNKKLLTSPITFASTANSSIFCGGDVVFSDIDKSTANLSPEELIKTIKKNKVHAISPVHFAGLPCDMEKIKKISNKTGAFIYEDAAHAFGARYKNNKKVGSCCYSDMTVFSFHPVKSIATGEGGAITTNNKKIYEKLKILRSHGIEKEKKNFINNKIKSRATQPWYYEMQGLGYNYRITDIQCSLGISQLKKINKFLKKRKQIAKNYDQAFNNLKNCTLLHKGMRERSSNHLYILLINFRKLKKTRSFIMKKFLALGIITQVHYIPVFNHPYYKNKISYKKKCPNSISYYNSALSIPLYYDLSKRQQEYVIKTVKEIIG
jgi:perosamine synthetase|tara:strand:+ start:589 stop:1752 length:1164 start_codon:yes stop_codon:yes gene_type:complete